jgi:hypothetical protein
MCRQPLLQTQETRTIGHDSTGCSSFILSEKYVILKMLVFSMRFMISFIGLLCVFLSMAQIPSAILSTRSPPRSENDIFQKVKTTHAIQNNINLATPLSAALSNNPLKLVLAQKPSRAKEY